MIRQRLFSVVTSSVILSVIHHVSFCNTAVVDTGARSDKADSSHRFDLRITFLLIPLKLLNWPFDKSLEESRQSKTDGHLVA